MATRQVLDGDQVLRPRPLRQAVRRQTALLHPLGLGALAGAAAGHPRLRQVLEIRFTDFVISMAYVFVNSCRYYGVKKGVDRDRWLFLIVFFFTFLKMYGVY